MGFNREARRAGTKPKITPTDADAATATSTITGLMYMGQPRSFATVNDTPAPA